MGWLKAFDVAESVNSVDVRVSDRLDLNVWIFANFESSASYKTLAVALDS